MMSDEVRKLTQENRTLKGQLEPFRNKEISDTTNLCKQNYSSRIKNAIGKYQQGENLKPVNIESIDLNK